MKSITQCSFCQKRRGLLRDLVARSTPDVVAAICGPCLKVCRAILDKDSRQANSDAEPTAFSDSPLRQDHIESICCSFCDTPQEIVDKLIRSHLSTNAAYICDKCVDAGARMMEQDALSPQNLWLWIKRKIGIHNSHLRHAN